MNVRPTAPGDIEATFDIRSRTRQNPVTRSGLSALGITPESVREKFAAGIYAGWVCEVDGTLVGFCTGDLSTGEVLDDGDEILEFTRRPWAGSRSWNGRDVLHAPRPSIQAEPTSLAAAHCFLLPTEVESSLVGRRRP